MRGSLNGSLLKNETILAESQDMSETTSDRQYSTELIQKPTMFESVFGSVNLQESLSKSQNLRMEDDSQPTANDLMKELITQNSILQSLLIKNPQHPHQTSPTGLYRNSVML